MLDLLLPQQLLLMRLQRSGCWGCNRNQLDLHPRTIPQPILQHAVSCLSSHNRTALPKRSIDKCQAALGDAPLQPLRHVDAGTWTFGQRYELGFESVCVGEGGVGDCGFEECGLGVGPRSCLISVPLLWKL